MVYNRHVGAARPETLIEGAEFFDEGTPHGHITAVDLAGDGLMPGRVHAPVPAYAVGRGLDRQRQVERVAKLDAPAAQHKLGVGRIMAQQVVHVVLVQAAIVVSEGKEFALRCQ